MKVYDIASWKTQQISKITTLINNEISAGSMSNWIGYNNLATTPITNFINGLTYTNLVSPSVIINQLYSIYTYASIKNSTIFDDPTVDSRFVIGDIVPSNDFRTISSYQTLPELSFNDFTFYTTAISAIDPLNIYTPAPTGNTLITYPPTGTIEYPSTTYVLSYGVSANTSFYTIKENIESNWSTSDLASWNAITALSMSLTQRKIMYMVFNKPTMQDVTNPIDIKYFMLNNMYLSEVIDQYNYHNYFGDVFSEYYP